MNRGLKGSDKEGLSPQAQCVVFLIALGLVVSRRPDLILHAHFYAEDGAVWYADAYNFGWLRALTITSGGYLNSLQRLVAALSLLVPLRYAPLFMNVCALAIQVLPASFLLSKRCVRWGPLHMRLMQAALYILIPNTREIHMILTNAPFHFALLAFLVALAAPPERWGWRIFDIAVLAISALSGPFCILIFPIVLIDWCCARERSRLIVAAILGPLMALQGAELLLGGYSSRTLEPLGATPLLLLRLLSGQIYVGSLWGENGFAVNAHPLSVLLVAIAGTSVLVYAFGRGRLELRLFIVFAMLLLAASLSRPLIDGPLPQWQLLAADRSARYWFFPMLAVLWSLLFCATQHESRLFRALGLVTFAGLLHGVIHDRHYPATSDAEFQAFLKTFEAAPKGLKVLVPNFPAGSSFYLTKK